MIQNMIIIRRGTNPKTAFKKAMRIVWDNILVNSRDFKTISTLKIIIEKGER